MEQEVIKWEQKKIILSYANAKMRIAVCSVNKKILQCFKDMLYSYGEQKRLDFMVDCFLAGEEMLSFENRYDIIIMGYRLAGSNGLEIAQKLRCRDNRSAIIFISENTDFVLDSFKVNPYRYLVLPIGREEFFVVLDEFFKKFGCDRPVWIKNRDSVVSLNTAEIFYLEADNKHCFVHLKNEALPCRYTMARVFKVLPKCNFSKINRAFVVNLNYISRYNSETVYLKNGRQLHISRNYLKEFKESYKFFQNPRLP